MAHILLDCGHVKLVCERSRIRTSLIALGAEADTVPNAPRAPDFDDPIVLYTVLMLCTGIGALHHIPVANPAYNLDALVPVGARTRSALLAREPTQEVLTERRLNHRLPLSSARMRPAAAWVSYFTQQLSRGIATESSHELPARIGERLICLVCDHSQRLFSARRRVLQLHVGFAVRDRDPGADHDGGFAEQVH